MTSQHDALLSAVTVWLNAEPSVRSAVLFGSTASGEKSADSSDGWSDIDLHVITNAPAQLERMDWARALPSQQFCLHVARPATGGVRKITVLFAAGQIDLVAVPATSMKLARLAMNGGLHRRLRFLRMALNEMATTLRAGYRFIKGATAWEAFYARVASEMPGVRLNVVEAGQLADIFLCELLWVLQKLERGELMAAQLVMHRSLAETNFRLMRELRLRRGQPLPSFGLARRAETLLTEDDLARLRVDARLDREELRRAAWNALAGLKQLMSELAPVWRPPVGVDGLLARHAPRVR